MKEFDYEVLLFDLDGTIIDSLKGILNSINYTFRKLGIKELRREDLLPFIGPPIVYTLQMYYGMSEEDANNAMKLYHEYYKEKGWKEFSVYKDVDFLIKELKKSGKKIGLATNKPRYYAIQILEYIGIDIFFDYIGGSNLDKGIINKKLVIEDCLENLNIDNKQKVVMIGDRHFDVDGATQAGIDTIGITYGYGDAEELEKAGTVAVADTPREILMFLKIQDIW